MKKKHSRLAHRHQPNLNEQYAITKANRQVELSTEALRGNKSMVRKCPVFRSLVLLQCLALSPAFSAQPPHCSLRPVATEYARTLLQLSKDDDDSTLSQNELEKLTVPQLKEELRQRGLKVSGRKEELIERLNSSAHDQPLALAEEEEGGSSDQAPEHEEEQLTVVSDVEGSSDQAPADEEEQLTVVSEDTTFESLGLSREILSSVRSQRGWAHPTPVQRMAIPRLLNTSTDSIWCEAPTGSGKTAAYALPLLEKLRQQRQQSGRISSLVICPTRELAVQIGTVIRELSSNVGGNKRWRVSVIHGGVPLEPQIVELANAARDEVAIDVLIATPGRLVDVLTYYDNGEEETTNAAALERRVLDALDNKGKGDASLSLTQIEDLKLDDLADDGRSAMKELMQGLEVCVLDEADRLLGGAFETELDNVLELLPAHKLQTWLFSATFPKQIEPRADFVLKRICGSDASLVRISCLASDRVSEDDVSGRLQKRLQWVGTQPTLEQIGPASTIQLRTIRLEQPYRTQALRRLLEENKQDWDRVLVFVATRYAAQHVARKLTRVGIDSAELHGKLDQKTRLKRLSDFKNGKIRILLATDVASRGLDVVGLPAVVNYDLPRSTADFVHRVGRTGRAGRPGTAVSFVTPANEARLDLIEKRHLVKPVEREVLAGLEPNEDEWKVKSEASRISAPGTVHSKLGLAHDRMHGGIKGHRKSKKDRLREKAARKAGAVKQNET
jgi:superfamily II DNA/RNA helicase